MAFAINRVLVEREWVIPWTGRMAQLAQSERSEALRFRIRLFGHLGMRRITRKAPYSIS